MVIKELSEDTSKVDTMVALLGDTSKVASVDQLEDISKVEFTLVFLGDKAER